MTGDEVRLVSSAVAVGREPAKSHVVRITCIHCDRAFVRHTRKALHLQCPHCGEENPGPAMMLVMRAKIAREKVHPAKTKKAKAPAEVALPAAPAGKRKATFHVDTPPAPSTSERTRAPEDPRVEVPVADSGTATRRGFFSTLMDGVS